MCWGLVVICLYVMLLGFVALVRASEHMLNMLHVFPLTALFFYVIIVGCF